MGDEAERYSRIVRAPVDDPMIITPPKVLLDEAERLGQDPRKPRTAIARFVATTWAESRKESIRRGIDVPVLDARADEKELMERPAHFPSDFGLGLIPFPNEVGGWVPDKTVTTCYTSLSTPKPFDPHLHGDLTPSTVGFGYHYSGKSSFPDRYDVVSRRGGGPRGGFAFTTGPTEGNYPQTILPSPTFNLGVLGFSDGGFNPEGLQYTNRPRTMRLTGLRNGFPHRAFFVRSRQVMFRNVYGPISTDEATPQAPTVVLNGSKPLRGVLGISATHQLNAPRQLSVAISSVCGRRASVAKIGDTVQVYATPRRWANPPLIFTGFVSDIEETTDQVTLTCLDSLGFLSNETILNENIVVKGDAASIIKSVIAGSSYAPPIGRISTESRVTVPSGITLKGKTRLAAIQTVLGFINIAPTPMTIYADERGYIHLRKLQEVDDTDLTPLVAGRMPRTDTPQDFYPTSVERQKGDLSIFNVVVVKNSTAGIDFTFPPVDDPNFPRRPVHRVVNEKSVTSNQQAEQFAKLMLSNNGRTEEQFVIEGLPERYDIYAGDVMEFASMGIAGRHRIFRVSWEMTPNGAAMTLDVGRQPADLVATLRFASDLSF
ncbi:MAG: hypothetical protein CMF52_09355 [Legionellales bacterium]|nr:hypothetical protein [Legionellales bacterium]